MQPMRARINGAMVNMPKNADIQQYIDAVPEARKSMLLKIHTLITTLYPDATVDMHYKMPTYIKCPPTGWTRDGWLGPIKSITSPFTLAGHSTWQLLSATTLPSKPARAASISSPPTRSPNPPSTSGAKRHGRPQVAPSVSKGFGPNVSFGAIGSYGKRLWYGK
jgi:hypothetical protein